MSDELPHTPSEVCSTYETIADDFDRTRSRPWPAVSRFVATRHTLSVAADIGCGNGRHSELLVEAADACIGIDLSPRLLELARQRVDSPGFTPVRASATTLPLADDCLELGLFIATIHHLSDRETRIASLDELARVLATDGVALVSGWSIYHDRFAYDEAVDTTVEWTLPSGESVSRYYHLYDRDDFDTELSASDLIVERSWVEAGNCFAVVSARGE